MRTLPRHLVLAAVVLTVCCAQRQAVSAPLELQKSGAQVAGDSRFVQRSYRLHRSHRRLIQPAATAAPQQARAVFAEPAVLAAQPPATAAVHSIYPPSRFRLPPPAILA